MTATGPDAVLEEVPIQTELLTREVVDTQVKTTLAEAFQTTIPGVRMEMNCPNCCFMQVRMNGVEGNYTQILENGLRTNSDPSETDASLQPGHS